MPKKMMTPSAFKNITQQLYQLHVSALSLSTEEAKIRTKRINLVGYRDMVKEIFKCKEAYGY